MIVLLCIVWVLLGIVPSLWIVKYDDGNVTVRDLVMCSLFGSLLGPIWGIFTLIASSIGDKKIF